MTDTQHEAAERVSDDIVARLRADAAYAAQRISATTRTIGMDCLEAADLIEALRAHDAGQAGVVALSASERSCYDYPGEDQQELRAAFIAGAVYATRPEPKEWRCKNCGAAADERHDGCNQCAPGAFPRPEPTGSLVGDALAAAGQSLGMSVTRVHPDLEKVGEATDAYLNDLEETLGALEGEHGKGWVNISMKERRLFAKLLRAHISATPPVADARRVEE